MQTFVAGVVTVAALLVVALVIGVFDARRKISKERGFWGF